ncbi:response regulator [Roseateles sp. MS654]|uniref:response regulator n=1 Tax=Roseateles sp. MS654 TaxID=3412685 RepID=UPI003C2B1D0C
MVPASDPIRVLTVDDHPLMREGIAAVLDDEPDMAPVGEADNGWQALQAFERLRPDVTLLDIQMPVMDGLEALARLRALSPGARVIVLTTFKTDAQAWQALKLGAVGYLLKTQLRAELLDAIRAVHRGHRWIPNEVAQEIAAHAGHEQLSGRELDVLEHIAQGLSNREIGGRLSLSEDTIKARVKTILAKLDARDRTHAVVLALKRGLLRL